jgi:ABC-type transporter MlaC component
MKMWRVNLARCFVGISFVLCLSRAQANETLVKKTQGFVEQLVVLAKHSQAKTKTGDVRVELERASQNVDFEQLARKSFGSRWVKFSKKDRADFLVALRELLEKVVYPKADRFQADENTLQYLAASEKSVRVTGQLSREKKGQRVLEQYEIVLEYDPKTMRIVDAVLEGERLSTNLKRQFDEALKKKSFAEIVQQMKKRSQEASS